MLWPYPRLCVTAAFLAVVTLILEIKFMFQRCTHRQRVENIPERLGLKTSKDLKSFIALLLHVTYMNNYTKIAYFFIHLLQLTPSFQINTEIGDRWDTSMPETKRKCSSLAYFWTVPPLILKGTKIFFQEEKEKRERDNCEHRKIMEDLDYYSSEKRVTTWKGA